MTDLPHENTNQSTNDLTASMTEAELLAELLKILTDSDNIQSNLSADESIPSHDPLVKTDSTAVLAAKPPAEVPVSLPESLPKDDPLIELQRLLFNFDQTQLHQLWERLENPERRAADVGQVLHQALLLQTLNAEQCKLLVSAIVPTVEQAIQESVQRDELVIANSIFPIMGPAIRKAIATTLETTMQALDQMLEQSLSPRALQWKLESLRTGKSFAEVVLLRTLLYRVEQVFLIHRPSGLLLQHVTAPAIAAQDPELVSSMLHAITDFMRDSFTVQTGDTLETLRFGGLTIWIEQGPHAVLAGVLRGQAPVELRLVFRRAIERIHQEMGLALAAFQGVSSPFTAARPHLEACFCTEYKTPKAKKGHPYFWILFACVVSGVGFLGYREWQSRHRWAAYLQQLKAEPGIVITTAEKRWDNFFIAGLRDPLAIDPATLLPASKVDPKTVKSQWQPYLSLHPKLLTARAEQILQPPATVSLNVDERGILTASGVAPLRWIKENQKLARAIPGITQFKNEVASSELQALAESRRRIEAYVMLFQAGSSDLPANPQTLPAFVKELQTLTQLATRLQRSVHVQIIGRASRDGSEAQNISLSQDRANAVLAALIAKGVNPAILTVTGIGTKQPLSSSQASGEQLNRSVTFKVLLTTSSDSRIGKP